MREKERGKKKPDVFTAFQCFGVEVSIADLTVLGWSLCPSLSSSDLSSYTACKYWTVEFLLNELIYVVFIFLVRTAPHTLEYDY